MNEPRPTRQLIEPRQERSRKTLDRLLDAAETLLEEKTWDEITIAAIVRQARSSVGSFYARFPTKEALVTALLERYHQQLRATAGGAVEDPAWHDLTLAERARQLIEEIVLTCRNKRGLLRLRLARRLAGTPDTEREPQRDRQNVDQLEQLFGSCRDEVARSDFHQALRFGLRLVDGVAVSALGLDDVTSSYGPIDDATLVDELTTAFVAYLRSPGSPNG